MPYDVTITEESRYQLHKRLEESLGATNAGTLMALLPPVGWADVATKSDLNALRTEMDLRFQSLEHRMDLRFEAMEHKLGATEDRFEAALERQTRKYVTIMTAVLTVLLSIAVGFNQLLAG